MVLDKARTLLQFIKTILEVTSNDEQYQKMTLNCPYSYHIKIVGQDLEDIAKFTIGMGCDGKFAISPKNKPDVVITLTENAFFSIIKGNMTLEEAYFGNEADLWSKDGNWTSHCLGIKSVFDAIETATRRKIQGRL